MPPGAQPAGMPALLVAATIVPDVFEHETAVERFIAPLQSSFAGGIMMQIV